MLATLIESRAQRSNSFRAQTLSFGLHAALISAAIAATQRAAKVLEPIIPDAEAVWHVRTPPPEVAPRPASTIPVVSPFKGFSVLSAPLVIPEVLPPIDVTKPLTDPGDYFAPGLPGGRPDGVEDGVAADRALTVDQVDLPARLLPGSGRPAYPEALRSAGLAGEVNVQFVIDTAGRADMRSVTIISSTHERFTETVRRALERARFAPAEFGGRKVRQVVRMPFLFSLAR